MIDQTAIKTRLDQLKAERDQHLANANACVGAIQQCEWFLAEYAKQNGAAIANRLKLAMEDDQPEPTPDIEVEKPETDSTVAN